MYDPTLAGKFIKDFYRSDEDTRRTVSYIFKHLAIQEKDFNKNLFEFSYDEAVDTLRYLNCSTRNSLAGKLTPIQNYEKWADSKGITRNNWSNFSKFSRDDLRNYLNLDALRNQYLKNRDELYDCCSLLQNPQDQAILVLLYEGIRGEAMGELRFLKKDDVDLDKKIITVSGYKVKMVGKKETIVETDNIRYIDISDHRTIEILSNAKDNTPYLINNGEAITKAPYRYLIDSPYMLRPTKNSKQLSNDLDSVMNSMAINNKMFKIRKWIQRYDISAVNVHRSGMFEKLEDKKRLNGELTIYDYKNVLERFGENPNRYNVFEEDYLDWKWALSLEQV